MPREARISARAGPTPFRYFTSELGFKAVILVWGQIIPGSPWKPAIFPLAALVLCTGKCTDVGHDGRLISAHALNFHPPSPADLFRWEVATRPPSVPWSWKARTTIPARDGPAHS